MNSVGKIILIFVGSIFLLIGCSSGVEQKNTQKTYVVKTEPIYKKLYFTGVIQPLRESAITSSMEAVVETMHFHYGQHVKKGDVVLTLNSSELQKQYNDTLTEYLKAKDSFTIAQAKFTGTEELWNAGLMSKNNFLSEKSSLATARISLMQATRKLTEMLEKMDDGNSQKLSALSISEFEKVRQALSGKHNKVQLKAPTDGILLYPPKATGNKVGKLSVGTTIKSGQVLALVGDLNGVSIEIDVPETDIDKIHVGMKAKVTGVALGKQVLKGELVAVNAQASTTAGGTLPSFSAVVEVKALNEQQRSWVKVGMSASIEIAIDNEQHMLVPITAVEQKRGQSVVKVQHKDGSLTPHPVTTGAALADKVVVLSGLKTGDVVAYD